MFKNKISIAIVFLLMLTLIVTPIALPTAKAHTPPLTVPTWAYISVQPNPSGARSSRVSQLLA